MNSPRQLLPGFFLAALRWVKALQFFSGSPLRKAANKSNAQSRLFSSKKKPGNGGNRASASFGGRWRGMLQNRAEHSTLGTSVISKKESPDQGD
jgi:hypothetical protein